MIVFCEGPDRTFKSTNVLYIHKCLSLDKPTHIIHCVAIKNRKDAEKYYKKMFDLFRRNPECNFILDRSHIGDAVYSPIYRNYNGDYIFDLELEYPDIINDAFLFVFVDEPTNILKRDDGNSQSANKLELIEKEVNGFKRAFELSNIKNKYLIHIAGKSKEEIANIIQHKIMKGIK